MVREVENDRKWFTPNNTWSIGWLKEEGRHTRKTAMKVCSDN